MTSALVCALDWALKAMHPLLAGNWIPHRADRPVFLMLTFMLMVCLLLSAAIRSPIVTLATGLMLGGCSANLLDLAVNGMVWDMIPFPWDPGHLCNLADIAIVLGAIITILAAAKNFASLASPKVAKI